MKIFISTHPFGSVSSEPLEILQQKGIKFELNPYGRKIRVEELKEHLRDKDGLIAGTEKLDKEVLECAPGLKIIARVGIGLDGIDFSEIVKRKILLTYTPEAVSQAVAELTVANMLNLARFIPQVHLGMKSGAWNRIIGFEITGKKIGIIGFGRVGQRVARLLQGFSCELLANDIAPDEEIGSKYTVTFRSKEEIYRSADIITLHVPSTPLTNNLINEKVLGMMKNSACLINTSRGGIVNENDLYYALKNGQISAAALDVYEIEPYIAGRLCGLDNILLTCHSGSCSKEARSAMELGAAKEIARLHEGLPPLFPVTPETMEMERAQKVVPINAEWHELLNTAEERKDEKYKLYRYRWGQYPTHSIVGLYPLNIDIELVNSRNEKQAGELEGGVTAVPSNNAAFMDPGLYRKIIEELKGIEEPVAVKLGFRGDPLFHPDFVEMLRLANTAGCIESILTTRGFGLTDQLLKELVQNRLDVLIIYLNHLGHLSGRQGSGKTEISELCRKLDLLKQHKVLAGVSNPRVKIFTRMDPADTVNTTKFTNFWRHWSDITAVIDDHAREDNGVSLKKNIKWACSRLWQRLVISYDGKFLLCNYDFKEECVLGRFPEMSIKEAWNSDRMNQIRLLHVNDRSSEVTPCSTCSFRKIEISKLSKVGVNGA